MRRQFRFSDRVPYGFRDMGLAPISNQDSNLPENEKRYDFIYSGSVRRDREMEKLFNAFSESPLNKHSLLVLSRDYSRHAKKFSTSSNIKFYGPVHPKEVPQYLLQSRYAINYRPLIEPHSHQTPAKLLEYAACRIPILTSDFVWVREFCKCYGGRFFILENDLSNLSWENVTGFSYAFPQLKDWTWENQIRKSGILEFLESHFPELRF